MQAAGRGLAQILYQVSPDDPIALSPSSFLPPRLRIPM